MCVLVLHLYHSILEYIFYYKLMFNIPGTSEMLKSLLIALFDFATKSLPCTSNMSRLYFCFVVSMAGKRPNNS